VKVESSDTSRRMSKWGITHEMQRAKGERNSEPLNDNNEDFTFTGKQLWIHVGNSTKVSKESSLKMVVNESEHR
jgi:hypothetical protein